MNWYRLVEKLQPASAYKSTHIYINRSHADHYVTIIVLSCLRYEITSISYRNHSQNNSKASKYYYDNIIVLVNECSTKKASQLESQYYSYSLSVVYSNLDFDIRFMWTIPCSSHTVQEIVMISISYNCKCAAWTCAASSLL